MAAGFRIMATTSPIQLTLRPTVHAVAVDEHLVLLDTAGDAYHCLRRGGDVVIAEGGMDLRLSDERLARDLEQAGLTMPAETATGPTRRRAIPATASLLRDHYPRPEALDLIDLFRALIDVLRDYRARDLAQILAAVDRRPSRAPPAETLDACVDGFHRWIPYAPVSGKCLLRSFMLLRFLQRRGHRPDWVFGVTTWPFRAHCWLQADGCVLDDELDRVRAFTPILVA